MRTIANKVGIVKCLWQPGQLPGQPEKSMRETASQLIKSCVP